MIDIAIIIVNWNGIKHLQICLDSLYRQSDNKFEIIFVDNGSTDDSVSFVRKNFPMVKIIEAKKNYGFAEGNNIGMREILKNENIKYIVALNNDTEVAPDWLQNLKQSMDADDQIGAVSSKTLFFDKRDIIDSAGDFLMPDTLKVITRGYREKDLGQFNIIEQCFSARATAVIYRRVMLEDIKMGDDYFDRYYFAYIEDTDLSIRARLRGWKIMYNPQAVVYHKVAATSGQIAHEFRRYYSGRNRIFTVIKDYPVSLWPLAIRGRQSVDYDYSFSRVEEIIIYVKIILSILFFLPRLIAQRVSIQKNRKIKNEEIKSWIKLFSDKKI